MFNKQEKLVFLQVKQIDEYMDRRLDIIEEGYKSALSTMQAKFTADLVAQTTELTRRFGLEIQNLTNIINNMQRGGVSIKSPEQEAEFYEENLKRSQDLLKQFKQDGSGYLAREIGD